MKANGMGIGVYLSFFLSSLEFGGLVGVIFLGI